MAKCKMENKNMESHKACAFVDPFCIVVIIQEHVKCLNS